MRIKTITFENKEELIKEVKEEIEAGKVIYTKYNKDWEEEKYEYCFADLDNIPDEFWGLISGDIYILFRDGNFAISEQVLNEYGEHQYWMLHYYKKFIVENFKIKEEK
jgi:hypothetical protein